MVAQQFLVLLVGVQIPVGLPFLGLHQRLGTEHIYYVCVILITRTER